jgi:sugar phosphate permease
VNIVVLGGLFLGMLLLLGTILIAWVADKVRAGRRG